MKNGNVPYTLAVMTYHVTGNEVRHIAFSTASLSKRRLTSSNLLPLQPTSQTCEASTFGARASTVSSSIIATSA